MRWTDATTVIQANKGTRSYTVPALLLVRKVFASPGILTRRTRQRLMTLTMGAVGESCPTTKLAGFTSQCMNGRE